MRYDTRSGYRSSFRSSFPTGVKWLLIINIVLFVAGLAAALSGFSEIFIWLGLTPSLVVYKGFVWQLFTYMFLHSPFTPWHILFNMLALWMFGSEIELTWGTRRFLKYYFICGVGAAFCVVLIALLFGAPNVRTIGASGAIYGLLLAYGLLFPDRTVFLLIFPIKAKYLVMIMGALAFYFSIAGGNSGVSNVAHLGGLVVGWVYLRASFVRLNFGSIQQGYRKWKLERAKRKFQVYLKKHDKQGSDRKPWVH
jgi:membrane associated rhomboid family serine protease